MKPLSTYRITGWSALATRQDVEVARHAAESKLSIYRTRAWGVTDKDNDTVARSLRELTSLKHPNLLAVDGVGVANRQDNLFLAGDYLFLAEEAPTGGKTLDSLIRALEDQPHPLTAELALSLAVELCAALSCLEAASPLLSKEGNLARPDSVWVLPGGQVKLSFIDLWLAKSRQIAQSRHTNPPQQGAFPDVRELRFFAPEELSNKDRSGVSVYRVGVLLYWLLSKQMPALPSSDSFIGFYTAILSSPNRPLYALNSALSEGLCALIDKALRKDARERHSSVSALEVDLCAQLPSYMLSTREHELAGMFAILTSPKGREPLVMRELERLSAINWLGVDAEMELASRSAEDWLHARLDEHLSALECYAKWSELPSAKVKVYRELAPLHHAARQTIPSKAARAYQEGLLLMSRRVRHLCGLTGESSSQRRALAKAALAISPSGPCLGRPYLWARLLESPISEIIYSHISHLFAFGDTLASPWEPILSIWERGCWPAWVNDELWVYVPSYRGEALITEPNTTAHLPTLLWFEGLTLG